MSPSRSLHLELIREFVRGDPDAYRRRCEQLDETGWDEIALVAGAAFYLAARRHRITFSGPPDVIRFVADTRAEMAGTGFDLDPVTAERLILATTDGDTSGLDDCDPDLIVQSELLMIWKLLRGCSADEMSRYLTEVDQLVTHWVTAVS